MERCPVCGEQRRDGARFCTTCGHRFASDVEIDSESPSESLVVAPVVVEPAEPVISGWPAPPPQDFSSPWAPSAENAHGWPTPPSASPEDSDPQEVTWAEVAATALPPLDRPDSPAIALSETKSIKEPESIEEFEDFDEADSVFSSPETSPDAPLLQRARSLMSELREVIDGMSGDSSFARDDLIGELEIALTPPAALQDQALADLRTTAEAAQERPRDLDTLTALTAQAETILALLVGYERATAGIERALATIRNGADPSQEKR